MKRKIDILKAKKDNKKSLSIELDQTKQLEALESVSEKIHDLYELINDKKEFDPDLFREQIKALSDTLDIREQLNVLLEATKQNKPEKTEEVSVKGLEKVIEAVKGNKPVVNIDLDKVEKAIIEVQQRIQDASVVNQAPDDYSPVRRVVKVGNRLVYDDQPTPSRGGGGSSGGSSSGGLTDAELRASPVDVTASIDTTGLATDTGQDDQTVLLTTMDASLNDIETAVETLDNAISGSEMQVDVVGALPAGNNNIGDVDIASSALPTGASTAAKQDTGNTSLGTIDTSTAAAAASLATLDNIVSGSEAQVDIVGALPAGNNNIGDVDIASSALPTGASTLAEQQTQTASLSVMDDWDDGADSAKVVGNVASAATDSGNPVKVGGKYNSTLPTFTNGQRGDIQIGTRGSTSVQLMAADSANTLSTQADNADGVVVSSNTTKLVSMSRNTVFNGTTWDRQKGDATDGTLVNLGANNDVSLNAGTNKIGDVDIAPRTTGGWSVANFTSGDTYTALTNTAQVIKASAGKFGGYYIYNPNAAATYVLIYDIAAASVTVGTSTAKLVFCIPAAAGANLELIAGIPFANAGWSAAAATTGGGNGAPATALEAMVYYV